MDHALPAAVRVPPGGRRARLRAAGALAGRPLRTAAVALLTLALLAAGCGGPDARPDVVVVMIDTLRPDHLGFRGHHRDTAPFLAELSREAVVFPWAYSTSSWTAPATASLFTSLHPPEHGVVEGFMAHRHRTSLEPQTIRLNRLPDEVETLPELLRREGYRTFGLATNINIGQEIGFDRGFDHFERIHGLGEDHSGSAGEVLSRLEDWEPLIRTREDGPAFVYLHFNDVHAPYSPRQPWYEPAADIVEDARAAYDSEIAYLDHVLRQIFERFDWQREALVVVVSDHGEEFLEHGDWGHNFSLYGELLRVLAMIRVPGGDGAVAGVNVGLIDVLPTLAELLGIQPPASWRGRSLVPLLEGDGSALAEELERRPLFAHRARLVPEPREMWAVTLADRKLIRSGEGHELYDTRRDPLDAEDRSAVEPQAAEELSLLLDRFAVSLPDRPGTAVDVELDEERLRALRSLGYVD